MVEESIMNQDKTPNLDLITAKGHSNLSVDLVGKLLEKNRMHRISISKALKHPWFVLSAEDPKFISWNHE